MANEDHVTRAGYAVVVWNRWRDEHPDISPDLSGANLSAGRYPAGKLFDSNLGGTDFRRSNLRDADFHGSTLEGADLSKTVSRRAIFTGANLARAELAKADFTGADFRGANLSGADLEKANFADADLTDATLDAANLKKADLRTAKGVTAEGVSRAHGDGTTRLPPGIARPASWSEALPPPE